MNSCAAISGLEAPSPARRAISASCAVRGSRVSTARSRAWPPLARNSARARSANAAAPAAQPLAVDEVGASYFHPQPGTDQVVDRLLVMALSGLPVADQRPRAGL